MKDCRGYCEHVAVRIDDLLTTSKNPESMLKCLLENHKFKLKGTGPIKCYLGCNFLRDSKSVLCFAPRKHAEKMISIFETTFGYKPSTKVHSLLEKGDYHKLDTSEFLETEGI